MTELPVLWSFRRCPYAMRARLALAVSGVEVETREVKLRAKPATMLAASPKGTVPVLVLPDGRVIDESIDIMRWALGVNDPEGWLDGNDRELIAMNDGPFKMHLDRYKYPERLAADGVDYRAAGVAVLEVLEDRLARSAFLCGERPTLADAAVMPFVRQFAAVDRDWFDGLALPGVQRWLAEWLASELFEAVMVRREVWVEV
ncbi:glutathione S-transferase [Sphingomonas turrisvirgatae]|uniref:Glutathione S-transferase n=1 Tax=Sphingomonas turrisvirgatae TaxID=1888892 RepID=A0A1E3LUA0_9SPHN|nr:glutathione S-transferase [Sphingomonas turrisvirgatae]ODP37328.1 glutathione S-transferase [Sphingomonas turrisvirgatae]